MKIDWLKILLCSLLLLAGTFPSTDILVDRTALIRFSGVLFITVIALLAYRNSFVQFFENNLRHLDIALFCFCIWQIICIAWAPNKAEAFNDGAKAIALLLSYGFFRFLLVSHDCWRQRLPLIFSVIATVFLALTYRELMLAHEKFGLDADSIYSVAYPSTQKNLISIYLMLSVCFHIFLLTKKEAWQRFLGGVNIVAMLPALFIIGTRSVSVSLVFVGLSLLTAVFLKSRFKKYGVIVSILLMGIGGTHWWYSNLKKAEPTTKTERLAKHQEPRKELANLDLNKDNKTIDVSGSINERYFLWSKTFKLIKSAPFFGVGTGNWKLEFPRNGLGGLDRAEFRNTVFLRPHNDYLWILAETGMVGLLLWLLVFLVLIRDFWLKKDISNVFLFGVLAYAMAAFFDFPKERSEHTLVFAGLLALSTSTNTFKVDTRAAKSIYTVLLLLGISALTIYGIRFSGERHYFDFLQLKAEKKFERAIRKAETVENYFFTVDHFNVPISWYAGICANHSGNMDKSEAEFARALKLNPHNFHVLNNLGFCLSSKQNYNEAIPLFEQSLLINAHFEEARFNLSYSLVMNGEHDRAVEVLERFVTDTTKRAVFLDQIEQLHGQ
jgi:hypothetical protein